MTRTTICDIILVNRSPCFHWQEIEILQKEGVTFIRELSLTALIKMIGQSVAVQDLNYNCYREICTVKANTKLRLNPRKKKNKYEIIITELWLENEEYKFEYENGKCKNGEFLVYSLS